jgi:hypothetical protein
METDLQRMLIKTVNVRRPTSLAADGTEVLATAVPISAYVEAVDRTAGHPAGALQKGVSHLLIIKDWPTELPGGIKYDDWVWMPGLSTSDLTLGKHPVTIDAFNDPELGDVDHYEVML